MRGSTPVGILILLVAILISSPSHAVHPLITDDTGTQGKGRYQVEFNTEFTKDKETEDEVTTKQTGGEASTIFSWGATDTVDLVLTLPYQWSRVKEDGELTSDEKGFSDLSMEVKWRFWETKGLSFAVKPGVSFPTGNEEKGLGAGKWSGTFYFITTAEITPLVLHFNAGYGRNNNQLDEREDLWHLSLAGEVEVARDLKLVGNIGLERNPDKRSSEDPAFVLGGLVYSILTNLSVDAGFKYGLNHAETDYALLFGLAFRF